MDNAAEPAGQHDQQHDEQPAGQHDEPAAAAPTATPLDLDGIERDLADVEIALARLDAGTYWADEATGAELPAELLAAHPTARTAG